jgi:hypothetical protein
VIQNRKVHAPIKGRLVLHGAKIVVGGIVAFIDDQENIVAGFDGAFHPEVYARLCR